MNAAKTLEQCARIEETVAKIYRRMAQAVGGAEELRSLWLEMAAEEDGHLRQIRLAQRLLREEIATASRISEGTLEQLANRANSILRGVHSAGVSADDALRVSIKLEQDFLRIHGDRAVDFADESAKQLFANLAKADEEHLARLQRFCRTRSDTLPADSVHRDQA
jgi:rubrerythrin